MRIVKFILVLVVLAAVAVGALLWDAGRAYGTHPQGGTFVEIPRGATTRRIAQLLAASGVVRSAVGFELVARLRGAQGLKAGEYHFDRAMTADEVLDKLARGDVYTIAFSVPEGLTIFQIAERVGAAGLATREEFLRVARNPEPVRDLAPQAKTLEGFLFPAKYEFSRRATTEDIAHAMVSAFRREWKNLTASTPLPAGMNVMQVVTMASLVERETPAAGERPVVAGVYYNRLKKGVALQCDPTVLYAMDLAGRNDGIIHQSDLQRDSPYNTYRNRGLPPGPIGNPGVASLRAAIAPAQTEYFYFVANTQGGHFFSRTLAEHNRNVARYRQMLRGQSVPAGARNGGGSGGGNGAAGGRGRKSR